MSHWLFFIFEKYELFEKWLLIKFCKIRGHHKYVNNKCDLCGFEIRIIQGEKKSYQIPTRSIRERERNNKRERTFSNKSKSKNK